MKPKNKFPNGIESYLETHYLIAEHITLVKEKDEDMQPLKILNLDGMEGAWLLCQKLTDKFEQENKNREWEGDFLDAIEDFLNKEIY